MKLTKFEGPKLLGHLVRSLFNATRGFRATQVRKGTLSNLTSPSLPNFCFQNILPEAEILEGDSRNATADSVPFKLNAFPFGVSKAAMRPPNNNTQGGYDYRGLFCAHRPSLHSATETNKGPGGSL